MSLQKKGLRVLAMAYKEVPSDLEEIIHHDIESNMVFAGLQGMLDPPRPEAVDAIRGCKEAGLRVVMITGDHATTASAIARKLGIITDESNALTGKEIETMTDDELFNTVENVSVFARVSPQHKIKNSQATCKTWRDCSHNR